MFKKKTENEKKITKIENRINKLKSQKAFFSPRIKSSLILKKEKSETISISKYKKITELDEKIIALEKELEIIKNDK